MAGAAAEAGTAEKAAAILRAGRAASRDCDDPFAGPSHARNPLPQLGFAAYIAASLAIPRGPSVA